MDVVLWLIHKEIKKEKFNKKESKGELEILSDIFNFFLKFLVSEKN